MKQNFHMPPVRGKDQMIDLNLCLLEVLLGGFLGVLVAHVK